jgi:hypothetical protein
VTTEPIALDYAQKRAKKPSQTLLKWLAAGILVHGVLVVKSGFVTNRPQMAASASLHDDQFITRAAYAWLDGSQYESVIFAASLLAGVGLSCHRRLRTFAMVSLAIYVSVVVLCTVWDLIACAALANASPITIQSGFASRQQSFILDLRLLVRHAFCTFPVIILGLVAIWLVKRYPSSTPGAGGAPE